ncbi:MAG: hypothetical protein ACI9WC_002380 [Arenicella sp.]|jgi:hypothetical protein
MSNLQKPGEKPTRSGEYVERGPRGGSVSKARQVTIEPRDDKLPPTQEKGRKWERVGPPK